MNTAPRLVNQLASAVFGRLKSAPKNHALAGMSHHLLADIGVGPAGMIGSESISELRVMATRLP